MSDSMGFSAAGAAAALFALGLAGASAPADADGAALAQKYGCLGCHSVEHKVVGPAYKDVAAKYKGDEGARAALSKKVREGGVGTWGQIPMPPNTGPSDAEIDEMVGWILEQ